MRFHAPRIAGGIYLKYFDKIKMEGMVDPGFLEWISCTMSCLTCAMLCHALMIGIPNIYKALSLGPNNSTKLLGSYPFTYKSWALAPAM